MFKKIALSIYFLLALTGGLLAQEIPESAVVLEKQNVTETRGLILWMPDAEKSPRDPDNDFYSCPDETRGSSYTGIAKVSLVDLKTQKIINTIEIQGDYGAEDNKLSLPYRIHRGYYSVPVIDEKKEGKPVLMELKDYNADGKPFEFALFDAEACQGLATALIGYSQKQDKVIQYQTELKTEEKTSDEFWVDYLFGRKPDKNGVWKYEIDYRGRAGTLDKYEIHYDKNREMFYGTLVSIPDEEKKPGPNK